MASNSRTMLSRCTRAVHPAISSPASSSSLLRPVLLTPGPFPPRSSQSTRLPAHRLFTTSPPVSRSEDPGGKPNDGSHPTIYDDFYNLLQSSDPESIPPLTVDSIAPHRITLSDGLVVRSPVIILDGQALMWDPPKLDPKSAVPSGKGWEEWEAKLEDIFQLFDVVEPKPEVVLFGTGASVAPPPASIRAYLNSLGIQLDVQSTRNAASTFNVLSEEGRKVAVCLLLSDQEGEMERKVFGADASSNSYQRGKTPILTSPGPSVSDAAAEQAKRHKQDHTPGAPPGQQRTPSTTRSYATTVSDARSVSVNKPESSSNSSSNSGSNPSRSRRTTSSSSSSSSSPLTLQHFLHFSQLASLYRSFIRSTSSIPNPSARWETIQWYRSDLSRDSQLAQGDLEKLKEVVGERGRMGKMLRGSMMLASRGDEGGQRGGRGNADALGQGGAAVRKVERGTGLRGLARR